MPQMFCPSAAAVLVNIAACSGLRCPERIGFQSFWSRVRTPKEQILSDVATPSLNGSTKREVSRLNKMLQQLSSRKAMNGIIIL